MVVGLRHSADTAEWPGRTPSTAARRAKSACPSINRRLRKRRRPSWPFSWALASTVSAMLFVLLCSSIAALGPIGVERAWADAEHNQVASESAMAAKRVITLPGMVPITADQIRDGVYEIEAESTSSFFKIYGAKLTVKNGKMDIIISCP